MDDATDVATTDSAFELKNQLQMALASREMWKAEYEKLKEAPTGGEAFWKEESERLRAERDRYKRLTGMCVACFGKLGAEVDKLLPKEDAPAAPSFDLWFKQKFGKYPEEWGPKDDRFTEDDMLNAYCAGLDALEKPQT